MTAPSGPGDHHGGFGGPPDQGPGDGCDFALTWDYRCPFARNLSEHVLVALRKSPLWTVRWVPFSLNQTKVTEGGPDVWDDPAMAGARLAVEVGVAVRDRFPDAFARVHVALFAARHDDARDIREESVVREVLAEQGLDPGEVFDVVATEQPRETFRREHQRAVADHAVFGVPTVIVGREAVFVRVMNRSDGDPDASRATVERVLDLVEGWPELNELKHTTVRR